MGPEALRLVDFVYFLEASLAVNLAFSLLDKLRDGQFFLGYTKPLYIREPNSPGSSVINSDVMEELERQRKYFEEDWRLGITKKMARFAYWAYIAVAFSYVLLAIVGFDRAIYLPTTEWIISLSSKFWAYMMVFLLGGPVPFAIIWFYLKVRSHRKMVKVKNDEEDRVMTAHISSAMKQTLKTPPPAGSRVIPP